MARTSAITGKKIVVKNDSEKPVPVEVIAEAIVGISAGIKKLRAGPLNEKALLLLIQNAAPVLPGYNGGKLSMREIKAVLDGIEDLEQTFLKKRPSHT